jgi:hypothetical protein
MDFNSIFAISHHRQLSITNLPAVVAVQAGDMSGGDCNND